MALNKARSGVKNREIGGCGTIHPLKRITPRIAL